MANKTFRRVLSIIMCAAMLVSVFAVSFTVSAVTETTSGETITTEWDFTKEEDYNNFMANSDIITTLGEGEYITHGESGLSYSPGSGSTVKQPIMYLPIKAEDNKEQTAFEFSALKSGLNSNSNQFIPGPSLVQVNGGTTYGFNFLITSNKLYLRSYYRKYGGGSDENANCKATVTLGTVKTDDIYSADYSVTKEGEDGTGISNICYTVVVNFKDSSGTVILTKTVKFNINGTTPSGGDLNGYCNNITGSSNRIQTRYGIAFGTAYQNKVTNTQVVTRAKLTTVDTTPTINAAANVVLNDGVNLKITASGKNIDKSTLALTVDGENVDLDSNGAAIIPKFAHQMTDKMVIKLTATGNDGSTVEKYIGDESGYSIANNLANIYNLETTSDNDKTLIAKLANYGAAAQKYYNLSHSGYYTAFANDFLDDTNKTTSEEAYKIFTNTASGSFINTGTTHFAASFNVGLALSLQDNVKMVAKISGIALGDNEKLYIKMDGVETELVNNGNDEYTAVFGEFSPKDYAADKIITLVVKSDGSEDEVSNEATYSVGAYINRMAQKNVTTELKTLLNTLAEYYGAAIAE